MFKNLMFYRDYNKHDVETDGSLLTAIFTIKNAISGGYFFVESILSAIPFVDRLFLNDGGSDDGTREYLKRIQEMFPDKIVLYQIPDRVGNNWFSIDNGLNRMIKDVKSEWIFEIQGDEILDPINFKLALKELKKSENFNSLRHNRLDLTWFDKEPHYTMRTVRFVRNVPNLTSYYGGDNFHIGFMGKPSENFTLHNTPPERQVFNVNLKHYLVPFELNNIEKIRRHAEELAPNASDRKEIYQRERIPDTKRDYSREICDHVPQILRGISKEKKYFVREELFDKLWLSNVGGLNGL